ncbi:Outer membrane receptor proteins, mostly Fe transport [Sphingobium sp. YR657]|uniref:TonB-dependent receptor n=1 Tax=Sphingobium sp. YR657 TaxID=1884366 RepID=UPI000920D003|nr:TonB-dependent receptor [Sphingobium sp. YR657]SHM44563.1 Outer membrane receptor proteins, mostly Fe transport [Sphingobium sp. YR657]
METNRLHVQISRGAMTIALCAAFSTAVPVAAQADQSAVSTDHAAPGDEIIVTAQKRAASIQDVPLSVAAISGDTLETHGIESTSDIARLTPGVAVSSTGPGRTQIIIRGISSVTGSQPTTGYYLDEVPISAVSDNIEGSLFDLNRVEVLRGPQGTLYGSASMGGAVKYISNQPDTTKTEGRADLTLSDTKGGGTNYAGNAVINLPLISELAALRVVGFYKSEDGYIDRYAIDPNNYLAIDPTKDPEKNVNSYQLWGFRAALGITPTENLRITPSVYYQKLTQDGAFSFDDPPGSYSNPIQARFVPDTARDEVQIYNLTATNKFGSDLELTSSSSYFIRNFLDTEDTSRVVYILNQSSGVQPTAFPSFETQRIRTKVFTQELRLGGTIGAFDFVVGGFYQETKRHRRNQMPLTEAYNEAFDTPFPDFDVLFSGNRRNRTEEISAFGQLIWHVNDRLRLTGGLRQFNIKESFSSIADGVFNGGQTRTTGKSSASGVTPKFGVDFDVNRDVMLYASATKGYRSGGSVNPVPQSVCGSYLADLGLSSSPTQYDPDSLWSYEAGVKSQFADRRITVNASAYHIDWSRIQQQVSLQCGFSFTGNFGSAVSRGLELETRFRPIDDLTLGINAGYTDAYLKDSVPGTPGEKGDRLLNVPKFTISASIDYSQPVSDVLTGFFIADASHVSNVLAEYDDTSAWEKRKAYEIVDMRIGVRHAPGNWSLAVFADNLFNEHATTGNAFSSTGVNLPTTRALAINRPRTIGLNLKAGF